MILNVAAGERITPEFIRVVLSGCLKIASLRAVVYTIPPKRKGLRIQTTDIILGEPGEANPLLTGVKKLFTITHGRYI